MSRHFTCLSVISRHPLKGYIFLSYSKYFALVGMACIRSLPTLSFSVDINFKSLEDVGIYVETSVAEYKRKIVVGVTGSLAVLGLWNPEKALFCDRQSENTNKYLYKSYTTCLF